MTLSRGKLLLFSALFFSFTSFSFSEYSGLTFKHLGPNCFGAALKIAGHYPFFRGVDAPEFSNYIKNYCVQINGPQVGSIGVFNAPNSDFLIHAFVHIDDKTVIEKSGVDYVGVTPIKVQSLETTLFVFKSSMECKRYSGDSPECHNELKYYQCENAVLDISDKLKNKMYLFEKTLEEILLGKLSSKRPDSLLKTYREINNSIQNIFIDEDSRSYLLSKVVSYKKQLLFLKLIP